MKIQFTSRTLGYLMILMTASLPFLPVILGKAPVTYKLGVHDKYIPPHGNGIFDDNYCDSYKASSILKHKQARAEFLKSVNVTKWDLWLSIVRVATLVVIIPCFIIAYITKIEKLMTIKRVYTFEIRAPFMKPHYNNDILSLEEKVQEKEYRR